MGPEGFQTLNWPPQVELLIVPRTVDIGGFEVHRALPFQDRRMVGPFIFWDQMGPGEFSIGHGVDVRPHPHIGLSTVTYLFDGSLDHRDSLGNDMRILPGDVNFMHAGSGIVHSERTGVDIRENASRLFGIQSWLAQPKHLEESNPAFTHTGAEEIPTITANGLRGRLIIGAYQGCQSPIQTQWETLYLELKLEKGTPFEVLPVAEERALFLVSGKIGIGESLFSSRQMIVLRPGSKVLLRTIEDAQLIILGGAPIDGPRYIWWNFVSSSIDRIRDAAADWKNGAFDAVPGDEDEYIPLPDLPFPKT